MNLISYISSGVYHKIQPGTEKTYCGRKLSKDAWRPETEVKDRMMKCRICFQKLKSECDPKLKPVIPDVVSASK